jgi:hypothetical protein
LYFVLTFSSDVQTQVVEEILHDPADDGIAMSFVGAFDQSLLAEQGYMRVQMEYPSP